MQTAVSGAELVVDRSQMRRRRRRLWQQRQALLESLAASWLEGPGL